MNEITQADRDLLDALNNTPAFRNREELKAHKLQEIAKHRLAAVHGAEEVVAWMYDGPVGEHFIMEHRDVSYNWLKRTGWTETPLYRTPPDAAAEIACRDDTIRLQDERIARLQGELRKALREVSKWARVAGEAQGKLEGSELAGVVDGWREKCDALEVDNASLTDELANDIAQYAYEQPEPTMIYVRFSDCGKFIRKWSFVPFEHGCDAHDAIRFVLDTSEIALVALDIPPPQGDE